MASSQQSTHRPPYPHQNTAYRNDYTSQQGRPSPIGPQSPNMMFSSPPSQPFSPTMTQPPAAKRPRLSEDAPSVFSSPNYPPTPTGQASSPVGALPVNGTQPVSRPGSMAPPQRPTEKDREKPERFDDDILRMSGIDIEAESQHLARQDFFSQSPYENGAPVSQHPHDTVNGPGSTGYGAQAHRNGEQSQPQLPDVSEEERKSRMEARADWEASRLTQYPLWDMFLYGGTLNERIREKTHQERLQDPQAGVLVNTQRTGPPPRAQVNGFEGAVRIIDKGQAILDSGSKGERLREVMNIISLAAKHRMTGLINASARLALERKEHSKGRVPTEWVDLAIGIPASPEVTENVPPPEASVGMKRTHSQADSGNSVPVGTARVVTAFQKAAEAERAEEMARIAKRAKRKVSVGRGDRSDTPDVAAMEAAVTAESSQKITKKAQREMLGRVAEKEQHRSANEAARMAVTGLMGSRFGNKKNKSYGWMNAGKSGTSTPTTPSRFPSSIAAPVTGTPTTERMRASNKEKGFSSWDEDKDPGIQVRDILLVLESDGRAPKAYLRGLEKIRE